MYDNCTIFYNESEDCYIVLLNSMTATGHKYIKMPFIGQSLVDVIKGITKQYNPLQFEIVDNAPQYNNALLI